MRLLLFATVLALLIAPFACGGDGLTTPTQCNDGADNDGDGMTDFPDDLGCTATSDDSEDSLPSPQCKDGRDNDDDGKIDYPNDPGCFAPQQDDEQDDCPDGPSCPECGDGKDNDMNGTIDFPADSGGCTAASDTDEYTINPVACGSAVTIKRLPFDGHATGTIDNTHLSALTSDDCGGAGPEDVYELRVTSPKVVVATTDLGGTTADTVLYIRSASCSDNHSELVCNDDTSADDQASSVTKSIVAPGSYYLVVDSHDGGLVGAYDLTVKFLAGEGDSCTGAEECGPGLVCRVPLGGTHKVCSKHVCDDGVDDDGDTKNDYPHDPGCDSPSDDDESDSCPGAGCPECADGIDNDGDTKIDFGPGGDPSCSAASSVSEACVSKDGVATITTAATMGTTVGAVNDLTLSCGSGGSAADKTYRLDLPAMSTLTIQNDNDFDAAVGLYNSSCGGSPLACNDEPEEITLTNLPRGAYYYVVDGYSDDTGDYTINVSGTIANGQRCESALTASGAITCNAGYVCKGTTGSKTCQVSHCADGLDNDGDGKIDYPNDPGCTAPSDETETNPSTLPACANGMDDDSDSTTDYPADFGCAAASGTTEVFCMGETDTRTRITTRTTNGTTVGKANDWAPACVTGSNAPDITYGLNLPVPVATLVIDTKGSGFDTVLSFRDTQCTTTIACNDEDPISGSGASKLTLSNVTAGGYAITVDGYQSGNGPVTLHVKGTVAKGTSCTSPMFSGGTAAVLVCPAGTTCTGTPAKCQ